MRNFIYTKQFRKDLKLAQKRGKDLQALKVVINLLIEEQQLGEQYKDHKLIGNFVGRRECHLQPDWLLVYKLEGNTVIFERTGTHSDLFA